MIVRWDYRHNPSYETTVIFTSSGEKSFGRTGKLIVCRKHGVSFYNPQMQEGWNECFIPHELAMKEACRLLFFVITDDTRAVTSMLEVCSLLLDTLNFLT